MRKETSEEELIEFVKANREKIEKLLDYAEEKTIENGKRFKTKTEEFCKKNNETCDAECIKGQAKEFAKAVFDPEVQRHFMRMGMEFALGMSALFDAIPKPDVVKDAKEKASEVKTELSKEFCDANPNCSKKKKQAVKKIEVN